MSRYRGLNPVARFSRLIGSDGRPLIANRAYEGATQGRRAAGWDAPDDGPNAALEHDLAWLIRRSRAAYRNIPWIRRAINSLVSNEIGSGIIPRFRCGNQALRDRLQTLWTAWIDEADADGNLNFYGLQALAVQERLIGGECFIRLRPRLMSDGLTIPLQIQLLESEQLPMSIYTDERTQYGIEISATGKRLAYWFYRRHPGERRYGAGLGELTRVPADAVIHHYQPLRAGQLRGEPAAAASLLRTRVFDDYEDAELARKAARAQITGFIRPPMMDDGMTPLTGDAPQIVDNAGQINLQPGTIAELRPGEEITLANSDDAGAGFADFQREQKLAMAAGLDLPYELMSGDYSKVNDRLMRAMMGEFHRQLTQRQDHLTIHQLCRGVVNAWLDFAVLSGAVEIPGYDRDPVVKADARRVDWRADGWPYLHALQDVQAKALQVRAGFTSRAAVVAEMGGYDVEDIDQQNADDADRAAELDLKFDTDVRAVATASSEIGGKNFSVKPNAAQQEDDDEKESDE
jgi:lambda family phage portal protein